MGNFCSEYACIAYSDERELTIPVIRAFFIRLSIGYKFIANPLLTNQYNLILCDTKTYDLPPQNTAHFLATHYAGHYSPPNRHQNAKEKAPLSRNRGTLYTIHPHLFKKLL